MRIEPLAPHHDRAGFDCGVSSLNDYLKRYARQNAAKDLGVTYVAVASPGAASIVGYYMLVGSAIARAVLPEPGLPNYPIPAALLGRLAVDQTQQGQGLGRLLLLDALRRAQQMSETVGLFAVEVLALDAAARTFYLKFGFSSLSDDPQHLYLPIKAVRKMDLPG